MKQSRSVQYDKSIKDPKVADQLINGTKFRTLTIVDVFSKEALAIEVGQRLRGEHAVAILNKLTAQRGARRYLFVDNAGRPH